MVPPRGDVGYVLVYEIYTLPTTITITITITSSIKAAGSWQRDKEFVPPPRDTDRGAGSALIVQLFID
jgi:hypothetical protein